jgi:RNA polymerase sigma-70 factor (ECF subfamily)
MPPERIGAEELFRRHAGDVGRFFRMLGIRGPTTEDLVQQVFLIVHRKGGYDAGPAKPMTWLRAIAVRVAADFRRGERRRRLDADDQALEEATSQAASPEEAAMSQEERGGLSRALASLSFDHRAVFVLFELERESCDSIARILSIPIGTVGSRLSAARAKVLEQYRPKVAAASADRGSAADPPRLRRDPAVPALLRQDLEAAAGVPRGEAAAASNRPPDEARIGKLLLELGVEREELGELVAQVFTISERLSGYGESSAATRLWEIAIHMAEDKERRRPRLSACGDTARAADLSRLSRRLSRLGFKQRAVLLLYEIEGESCASIGMILDRTAPDTVRALLHAARKELVESYRAPERAAGPQGGAP